MIITISGTPGSGKSTVAQILVKKLGLERLYIGGILRAFAKHKGMTIEELTKYAKSHPEIDQEVDEKTRDEARKLAQQGQDVLVEGRVQFFFLPESVKIFMKVDPEEAGKRIWKDLQDKEKSGARNEEVVTSVKKVQQKIVRREAEDAQRYKKLYNIDHRDESQYNLVIDTTAITASEAADKIMKFLKQRKK